MNIKIQYNGNELTIIEFIISILLTMILDPIINFIRGFALGFIFKTIVGYEGILIITNALHLNLSPDCFPLFTGSLAFLGSLIFIE